MIKKIIACVCFPLTVFSMDVFFETDVKGPYGRKVILPPLAGRDLTAERESLQMGITQKSVLPEKKLVQSANTTSGKIKLKDHLSRLVPTEKENILENGVDEIEPSSPGWASELLASGKPLIMKPFYL